MNLSSLILALRCLIADTFRQALASGMFWLVLTVTAVCIMLCLSVSATTSMDYPNDLRPGEVPQFIPKGDPNARDPEELFKSQGIEVVGEDTAFVGFGGLRIKLGRRPRDMVRFLQLALSGFVADSAGIMLALIWTAGFLPTFLEPSAVSVLLAKPAPRWCLILGKYLGVVIFVLFQAILFVGGTYAALAWRTGIWDETAYLLCIPMLLMHFAIFFGFSTLLAVLTRSTIACAFGTLLFWLICWGMNYGRHMVITLESAPRPRAEYTALLVPVPQTGAMADLPWAGLWLNSQPAEPTAPVIAPPLRWSAEVGYWLMPKPADLLLILYRPLKADEYFPSMLNIKEVERAGEFHPAMSIVSSLVFLLVILTLAAWQFTRTDY